MGNNKKSYTDTVIDIHDRIRSMDKTLTDSINDVNLSITALVPKVDNNTKEIDTLRVNVKKEMNIRTWILGIMSIIAGGLGLSGK